MLNQKHIRVVLAILVSLIGLGTTGILYLIVWMFMVLHYINLLAEYDAAMHPYVPLALLLALAVPFLLLNWWWCSLVYEVFRVPVTGLKVWLAEVE